MAGQEDAPAGSTVTAAGPSPAPGPALPLLGLLIGAWAIIPPYTGVGADLNTQSRVEVADHVVPGIIVLAVCAAVLLLGRRMARPEVPLLCASLVVVLAGFWMVSTHVPLLAQAKRHDPGVDWGPALYHFAPGLVLSVFGLVWAARQWSAASAVED